MQDILPVPQAKTTWVLLKRMLNEHGRDFGPKYAVAFFFMAIFAACTSATAWLMRDVINKIFVEKSTDALFWIPLLIVPLFVVKGRSTDIDGTDGKTGLGDFSAFSSAFLSAPATQQTDFDLNGNTGLGDFSIFSSEFLGGVTGTYCP